MSDYTPQNIEGKWQRYWQEKGLFKSSDDTDKPKFYVLDMFPYPSGDGLHVGHVEGYTATDIVARYQRLRGFNVLHPMGWDAFGLPAEQYAIKTGTHPQETTANNVARFKRQLQALGFSYDWSREINTTEPKFYRWTQWIFQQLFNHGLAYQSEELVNFCPELGTVLANEEVIDGKSEVGGFPVIKKPMRQWVLKITDYAERLLTDLDDLDWPESVKEMQRNWIGKSHGATIIFTVADHQGVKFEVFSTRPDTLFGATFCVLAPEHPLIKDITSDEYRSSVTDYVDQALTKSERQRAVANNESGVFTGAYAINPVNDERLPIYVADYVLMSYGSGAIMAVPAHDDRDYRFAKDHQLVIKRVIEGGDSLPYTGVGRCINSDFLDGQETPQAKVTICKWLTDHQCGNEAIRYKLRDWLFSRQRYWGEPFPLFHDNRGQAVLVEDHELPVMLPDLRDFTPSGTGESPLAKCKDFVAYDRDGKRGRRETHTMPQWAGSCWYYLRYLDVDNDQQPWDKDKERYWMPVDLYVGGVEHAVLHLLYSRFWHKVLYDLGYVSTKEPFQRLVNQGTILGGNGEKMSKSRGNVINPDDVIAEWGADSLRLYEMFMGPLESTKPWQTNGIVGCWRFLKKVWRFFATTPTPKSNEPGRRAIHRLIRTVSNDTEKLRFNTAIAQMMEFINRADKLQLDKKDRANFLILLSPYAPHICEELWQTLGNNDSIMSASWPSYDSKLVSDDQITYSVQVNGKHRLALTTDCNCPQTDIEQQALAQTVVQKAIAERPIRRKIFVKGKIVNFVV